MRDEKSIEILEQSCLENSVPCICRFSPTDTNDILIRTLYVSEKYRNRGIGTSTLISVMFLSDVLHCKLFLTYSDIYGGDAPRLLKFYQTFGFTKFDSGETLLVRQPTKNKKLKRLTYDVINKENGNIAFSEITSWKMNGISAFLGEMEEYGVELKQCSGSIIYTKQFIKMFNMFVEIHGMT